MSGAVRGRAREGRPTRSRAATIRRPRAAALARAAPRSVRVETYAKLNLGLAVGPRRADGFHEIATVFQSISLADTLIAGRTRGGFQLRIRHEAAALRRASPSNTDDVPVGADNLVIRAARWMARRFALRGGASFELIKRIPARSGLGGGSADAAAAILALDALYGLGLTRAGQLGVAAELGSDIPFAVVGGTAVGLGRGEQLTRTRLGTAFRAIVAVPQWRVSTARAFAELDRNKFGLTAWAAHRRFAMRVSSAAVEMPRALRLGNIFEKVLGSHRSDFVSLCARLRRAGLSRPALSGSGSAVFALLKPGMSYSEVAQRFEGSETLYGVRTRSRGPRVVTLE